MLDTEIFVVVVVVAITPPLPLVGWLVYPFSSLGWRYGANSNPGSCNQPN